jgi:hypothetical protein
MTMNESTTFREGDIVLIMRRGSMYQGCAGPVYRVGKPGLFAGSDHYIITIFTGTVNGQDTYQHFRDDELVLVETREALANRIKAQTPDSSA